MEEWISREKSEYKRGDFNPGSRDKVREKFREVLLSIDKVDTQLKAEKEMWHFCNLFPEDCEFDRNTLVQLWLARGFLQGEHKYRLGYSYFDILLSHGYILHTGTSFPEKIHTYCVNSKAKEDCNVMHKKLNLRPNLLYNDDTDEDSLGMLTSYGDSKALLLSRSEASRISKIPRGVFLDPKHLELEVLDLSKTYIMELPSSIGKMKRLRYLDLSHTLIELLPESIEDLGNLTTLKLKDCDRLLRLPKGMGKLTSLEHLELDVLRQLTFMPKGMGALTKLQILSAFLVDRVQGRNIEELKGLNNLKGRFCIPRLQNVLSPEEAKEAALSKKQHLKELELRWSDSCHLWYEGVSHQYEILEALCPNSDLEKLHISSYGGSKFPRWISDSCNKLTRITLFKCEYSVQLPALGQLPCLKFLTMIELNSIRNIGDDFRGKSNISAAFPQLERLEINRFAQLETWKEPDESDYPNLHKLIIEQCPKLTSLPSSLLCRNTLKHLEIIECSKLASLPEKGLSNSLQTLIIDNCPSTTKRLQKRREDWNKIQHVQNVWINQQKVITVV